MVDKMAKIGIVAGQGLRPEQARPRRGQGARRRSQGGVEQIMAQQSSRRAPTSTAGTYTTKTGVYGTDYLQRALRHGHRPRRQPSAGRGLSDLRSGRATASRYSGANKYVIHFPKGQDAAGQRLLVADDVRRRSIFFVDEPAQPVHAQPAQQAEVQRRRLDGPLHPERVARQGQGGQLAAGAQGQVRPDAADVLAEGGRPSILDGSWSPPAVREVAPGVGGGPAPTHRREYARVGGGSTPELPVLAFLVRAPLYG